MEQQINPNSGMPVEQPSLRELARRVNRRWDGPEFRAFVRAAKAAGYAGNSGGWIYHNGRCVTQGWQSLVCVLDRSPFK